MKFLVDVGVGKKVEAWLKGNGFDVLSVRDIDSHAKDFQILRWSGMRLSPITAFGDGYGFEVWRTNGIMSPEYPKNRRITC